MYGAIIGDLAGSIYEYDQVKDVKSIKMNKLIEDNAFFSDDTILTIAILDAIINKKDYNFALREYIKKYKDIKLDIKPYFDTIFSPNIIKWSESNIIGNSCGNGAMMRISPVGYLFDNEEDVINNARLATVPSHNSKEAIECATTIALIIFYLRNGMSKEEVFNKLNLKVEYKQFKKFNYTCQDTIGNCLYAFYNSNNFEDAIKKTLLMGGDTDTNCCIVGSMAESLYGIDDSLIAKVNEKLPDDFVKLLSKVKR